MEAIIMDCIRCGNADMVAVLLRYRSLSSAVRSIHLHSLITCSENAQQKKITETLRSLQLGDSTQVQNVAVPPILFISTPDSASLSRSSSSVSSCPHLPSDSTASQNVISKPINVLMRNAPLSMEDTGGNRLSKQIFVESEPAHSLVERETSAHNSTQTSGSKNFDERKEFLPFVVPLCTSTPSSNVDSARVVTHSNHYSVTLPSIPISSSPPISVTPAQNMAKSYIRSASEYSRTANSFEDPGDRSATVRSLPGHLAPQSSSTRDNDEIMGATFPIVASISLDPIPLNAQKQEMNIYVVAPGKEEIIDKEKCVAEAQNERERLARNPYTTNEQG
ncbi:unnamed protein product [Brugia timori]|uniref:ANK_REP_REGION domain-containing protein n=1 Tax=Brugia timori TaxID=42155 RepID=A0A0R3R4P5_9BILA|nr:unnamed protein product [Brugia timori]